MRMICHIVPLYACEGNLRSQGREPTIVMFDQGFYDARECRSGVAESTDWLDSGLLMGWSAAFGPEDSGGRQGEVP